MDFFLNLLKVAAPIIGSAFGPIGTAVGGLASGLIGSLQQQSAANEAERLAALYAQNAQNIANQLFGQIGSRGALKNMIEGASDILGGKLAATGLIGSSIADAAYAKIAADVVSRLYPAQVNAMLNAGQMAMTPNQWLFNMYSGAAGQAANAPGFDMGFLVDLAPELRRWFGGLFPGGGSGAIPGITAPNTTGGYY